MKKGVFKIKVPDGSYVEKAGYISKYFAFHKTTSTYTITHLLTGGRLTKFDFIKEAREFIRLAEEMEEKNEWKASWNSTDVDKLSELNGKQALKLFHTVKEVTP